jgi:hypothetical protein
MKKNTEFQGLLSLLDGDEPAARATKIRAFQTLFVLVICTEYWTKALAGWTELTPVDATALVVVSVMTAAALLLPGRRAVFAMFIVLQTWYLWTNFPHAGNHRYLELVLASLFVMLDEGNEAELRLLLRSVRWIVVVVLFYAGLHKLVHGYYFQGQFLVYSMWREGFQTALGPLLPAQQLGRLTESVGAVGSGPYLATSPLVVGLSNVIWIAEIGLAILLVPRRTRTFAWIGTAVLIVATEAVARELMFGVEFLAAVLLFARADLVRPLVRPAAVFLGVLVLIRLGLLPEVVFH